MDHVSIDFVKAFLLVADYGSFSKAAEASFSSVPTVSRQVKALEDQVGLRLFERTRKEIRLTPAGASLIEAARRLVRANDEFARLASASYDGVNHTLRFGHANQTCEKRLLISAVKELQTSSPSITVTSEIDSVSSLTTKLLCGDLDVIMVNEWALPEVGHIEVEWLGCPYTMAVMAKDHPLSGRLQLSIADLKDETLLRHSTETDPLTLRRMEGLLKNRGVNMGLIRTVANDYNTIDVMVAVGRGVTFSNSWAANPLPNEIARVRLGDPEMHSPFVLTWRNDNFNPQIGPFVRAMAQNLKAFELPSFAETKADMPSYAL